MSGKKILSELRGIEREIKESELNEYLSMIENRRSFHLGLVLGLVFAVVAGFLAIIVHEIFIIDISFEGKLFITILSGAILLFCLYLGLTEDRRNKDISRRMWELMRAEKKTGADV